MSKQRFTFQEQFSLVIDLNKGLTVEEAKALTDYANAIRKRERERIIKLLEEAEALHLFKHIELSNRPGDWYLEHKTDLCGICKAIALIKGENK